MNTGVGMGGRMAIAVAAALLAASAGMAQGTYSQMATEGLVSAWLGTLQMGVDERLAERPTYAEAEAIAAAAAARINPGQAARLVHVDSAATNAIETGSAAAPYRTIQAALDHIGEPADAAEYRDAAGRAYVVRVAPGVYSEDLEVPYRPMLLLDLDGATVRGTVTRRVPGWPYNVSNLVSRLTIRGDSLRSAYPDGQHAVTGIEGDIVFDGGGPYPRPAPSYFYALHVIHAGVSGSVRFENGSPHTWGHLFLERADVHGVYSTNGWGGVTVFSYSWGGGHAGGGRPGTGLGPLVGTVLPYNLQNVMISDGMRLETPWSGTCVWHNVAFEAGAYNVTNAAMGVRLDAASYNSWLA
ncbi:MAG: hypothetical protein FJ222_12275, partial [Lentisphaerae bacterium]|nr:hypothetical protein [Lentisphaerota bacterium]